MIRRREFIKRSSITRKPTARKKALRDKMRDALNFYFKNFCESHDFQLAKCQICAGLLHRLYATPAHLFRRWQGRHDKKEILAAHLNCHTWLDNSAHMDRITTARASGCNCETGGIIPWSREQLASLSKWIQTGIDPLH